jgi:hypothetical protein
VVATFLPTWAIETHKTALGLYRPDLGRAEFGGLLHDPVHFVSGAQGLQHEDALR